MSTARIHPPQTADEATTLRAFLDAERRTLRRQAGGLTAEQLATTLPPSAITLAGLLRHMAYVEDYWFVEVLAGRPRSEPWASMDWKADRDADWHDVEGCNPDQMDAALASAISASNARLEAALADNPSLDQLAAGVSGHGRPSLRWILTHMLQEYARHCGHADLIRESIDGKTGA